MLQPELYVADPGLKERLAGQDQRTRRAVAEPLCGTLIRHHVYVAPEPDRKAALDDLDNVPFFVDIDDPELNRKLARGLRGAPPGRAARMAGEGFFYTFPTGRYTGEIFALLDGKRSLREIFAAVRRKVAGKGVTDEVLRADFAPVFERMSFHDQLFLRHKSIPAPLPVTQEDWAAWGEQPSG